MTQASQQRLAYIDYLRGVACLLMFQTHCYDSWLSDSARRSTLFRWSQLGGTFPAPLFLFLAGVSFALVTEKLSKGGAGHGDIARTTLRRGAEIYGLGLLFRVQEFLLGQPGAPWTDLLRVDVLNIIGISMLLMAVFCWAAQGRAVRALGASGVAILIALLTPPLWTTARPRFLPWFLESYVNGVHTFDVPQPWLFPIFPWTAFAFAGLAAGWVLSGDWARRREVAFAGLLAASGACLAALGWAFDALPYHLYSVYDFWHTSPSFFLIRMGLLLILVAVCLVWCRWGAGLWGFSPMIQLGKTSLLVYWVHIEFVYGRFSILPKRGVGVGTASLGLLVIFLAMLLLSLGRTRWKGSGAKVRSGFARPASQQAG